MTTPILWNTTELVGVKEKSKTYEIVPIYLIIYFKCEIYAHPQMLHTKCSSNVYAAAEAFYCRHTQDAKCSGRTETQSTSSTHSGTRHFNGDLTRSTGVEDWITWQINRQEFHRYRESCSQQTDRLHKVAFKSDTWTVSQLIIKPQQRRQHFIGWKDASGWIPRLIVSWGIKRCMV